MKVYGPWNVEGDNWIRNSNAAANDPFYNGIVTFSGFYENKFIGGVLHFNLYLQGDSAEELKSKIDCFLLEKGYILIDDNEKWQKLSALI